MLTLRFFLRTVTNHVAIVVQSAAGNTARSPELFPTKHRSKRVRWQSGEGKIATTMPSELDGQLKICGEEYRPKVGRRKVSYRLSRIESKNR